MPLVRSFDGFAALCGRGGRRRGWRRSRRCGRRPPGARGTARGWWGGRASALRALHARAHYGRPCMRVGAWAPGGLRGPVAPSAGAGSARGCPRGVVGPKGASGTAPGSARCRPPVRVGSFGHWRENLGVPRARVTGRWSESDPTRPGPCSVHYTRGRECKKPRVPSFLKITISPLIVCIVVSLNMKAMCILVCASNSNFYMQCSATRGQRLLDPWF